MFVVPALAGFSRKLRLKAVLQTIHFRFDEPLGLQKQSYENRSSGQRMLVEVKATKMDILSENAPLLSCVKRLEIPPVLITLMKK